MPGFAAGFLEHLNFLTIHSRASYHHFRINRMTLCRAHEYIAEENVPHRETEFLSGRILGHRLKLDYAQTVAVIDGFRGFYLRPSLPGPLSLRRLLEALWQPCHGHTFKTVTG